MLMEKSMTAIQLQEKAAFSANITPRMKYEKWNDPRRLFYWKIIAKVLSYNFCVKLYQEQPEVRIKYFVPDEYKSGGAIVEVSGKVKKISAIL